MFIRASNQRIVPIENAESMVVWMLHSQSKAESIVTLVLRYCDDLTECVPGAVALEVSHTVFAHKSIGKMSILIHDTCAQADKLGLHCFILVIQKQWTYQRHNADCFKDLKHLLVDKNMTEFNVQIPEIFCRCG